MAVRFDQSYGSGHTCLYEGGGGPSIMTPPFTFSTWFKVEEFSVTKRLISLINGSTDAGFTLSAFGDGTVGGAIHFSFFNETSVSVNQYLFDQWHHAAVVVEGAGGIATDITVYLDGVAGTPVNNASNWVPVDTNFLCVGGESHTHSSSFGVIGCMAQSLVFQNVALSPIQVATLAQGIDGADLVGTECLDPAQPLTLSEYYAFLRLNDEATATENETGTDFTLAEFGAGISTCVDAPEFIECSPGEPCLPCAVDPEPCGETVEPSCNAQWPFALLQPRSVGIHMVPGNIGGGPAMAGGHEEVAATAYGFWRFTYADIPIHDRDQILAMREMEVLLEGRAGVICLHAYDGKRAPWLTVGIPIIASAASALAVGATSGSIEIASGGVPRPGMFFSWEDTTSGSIAGPHLYCLETVGAQSSGDTYPVTIWPPVRSAIAIDDPLEFDRPMCRARLADDRGMSMELHLLDHASQTIEFEEDI